MSGSITETSDLTFASLGYQHPTASVQTESSCVLGINNEESTGDSGKEQVSNFVGWTVYKRYGMYEVKGVVISYTPNNKIYDVQYVDGKREKVTEDCVIRYLSPCKPGEEEPSESLRMTAQNNCPSRRAKKAPKRKRASTAATKQSRKMPCDSPTAQTQTANPGSGRKKPYVCCIINASPGW